MLLEFKFIQKLSDKILLSTIINGSRVAERGAGLITINVVQTDNLGVMQGQPIDLGFDIDGDELTTTIKNIT